MSEKIIKGYLIKKNKYRSFDQIIQFLDTNGNKITCLSLGSLKVSSKNGMNLFIGSLIEFIIFQSRLPEKISKLKKCHIIEIFDWKKANDKSFLLLNNIISSSAYTSVEFFSFYKDCLKTIQNDSLIQEDKIIYVLKSFLSLTMIYIDPSLNDPFLNTVERKRSYINQIIEYINKTIKINLSLY